jgi:hypothetical protein
VSVDNDASIVRGESVEAGADTVYEEVVTGTVPVSEEAGVVEQGVQGQGAAIDQEGWASQRNRTGV